MKIHRTTFGFGILLLFVGNTFAQALPAKVLAHLKTSYAGYKLYAGDPICNSRAIVSGRFNGDGKADYAVMFKKSGNGYVIAFLSDGRNYQQHMLESGPSENLNGTFLLVGRKGARYAEIVGEAEDPRVTQRLKYDAPEGGGCEASSYFWIYGNGTFRRAFTSD